MKLAYRIVVLVRKIAVTSLFKDLTAISLNSWKLVCLLFLPVTVYGQFWELFATSRMITTDEGEFWPLRTFVPPALPIRDRTIHTVEIYNIDKLVEKIEFDNTGRVRSKTKYLPENEWAGLEEKSFGFTNHYSYEKGRTTDNAIGQRRYDKTLGTAVLEYPVEYREINAGMGQLKELGASFFSYSKGLFMRTTSFSSYGHPIKEQVKPVSPYAPIITYQENPKQPLFCYDFPEVKEVNTEKFYEVLYPNERLGSSDYSFDLFGLFKTIRAQSVLDSETVQKILKFNIPLNVLLSAYFIGTESTNIRGYADREAQSSSISTYRDRSHNLVAFEGTRQGVNVKGYNLLRSYGSRANSIIEFELPSNSYKVKRILFAMEKELIRVAHLAPWIESAIPKWRISIVGEDRNIVFVGNEIKKQRYAFVIPSTLINGSKIKTYVWQEGAEERFNYAGTPYSAPIAHLLRETEFTIKIY